MDTALSSVGQIIWRWLERRGLDAEALFAEQGIERSVLLDPAARVPTAKWDGIARRVLERYGRTCAGLDAAQCWHPSNLGVLGYAWLSSSTLRTALQRYERYGRIVGQSIGWQLENTEKGLRAVLHHKRDDLRLRTLTTDFAMSLVVSMCRFNFGPSLVPVALTLERAEPDCAPDYVRFYGCHPAFGAGVDSFTLRFSDADRLLPSSNRELAATHDRILYEQLARLHKEDVVARARAPIVEQLAAGEASEERVAAALHLSPRTLQRRLAELDTGFATLLDDTRRDLAERYLADRTKSITEISFLLGFSQQSSFARACRRWTGRSPSQLRETANATA